MIVVKHRLTDSQLPFIHYLIAPYRILGGEIKAELVLIRSFHSLFWRLDIALERQS